MLVSSIKSSNFINRRRMGIGSFAASPSSRFIPPQTPCFAPSRSNNLSFSLFTSPTTILCYPRSSNSRVLRLSASLLHSELDLSWFPPDPNSVPNNYGGWAVVQPPTTPNTKTQTKGFSGIILKVFIGSSVAVAIAAVAYFSLYRKGSFFLYLNHYYAFSSSYFCIVLPFLEITVILDFLIEVIF